MEKYVVDKNDLEFKQIQNIEPEKYLVYKNDLKFKKMQNIDPEKTIWYDENVKNMFGKDFDTLKARLKECKKGGFTYLDLSRLNLEKIPVFKKYKYYEKLKNIKYLFLNDNKLKKCGKRLKYFNNLEVLDVSFNELLKITFLPKKLKELICNDNKLKKIPPHDKLEILDCSNNNLESINKYEKLIELICVNNKILKINNYPLMKRLVCKGNPINSIENQENLEKMDCSETKLTSMNIGYKNLKELICNNTEIKIIENFEKLENLEIMGCEMSVSYIPTLKYLLCENSKDKITLSEIFKIKSAIAEGKSLYCIF